MDLNHITSGLSPRRFVTLQSKYMKNTEPCDVKIQNHMKGLLESFNLNGHTFHPQNQKLGQPRDQESGVSLVEVSQSRGSAICLIFHMPSKTFKFLSKMEPRRC